MTPNHVVKAIVGDICIPLTNTYDNISFDGRDGGLDIPDENAIVPVPIPFLGSVFNDAQSDRTSVLEIDARIQDFIRGTVPFIDGRDNLDKNTDFIRDVKKIKKIVCKRDQRPESVNYITSLFSNQKTYAKGAAAEARFEVEKCLIQDVNAFKKKENLRKENIILLLSAIEENDEEKIQQKKLAALRHNYNAAVSNDETDEFDTLAIGEIFLLKTKNSPEVYLVPGEVGETIDIEHDLIEVIPVVNKPALALPQFLKIKQLVESICAKDDLDLDKFLRRIRIEIKQDYEEEEGVFSWQNVNAEERKNMFLGNYGNGSLAKSTHIVSMEYLIKKLSDELDEEEAMETDEEEESTSNGSQSQDEN